MSIPPRSTTPAGKTQELLVVLLKNGLKMAKEMMWWFEWLFRKYSTLVMSNESRRDSSVFESVVVMIRCAGRQKQQTGLWHLFVLVVVLELCIAEWCNSNIFLFWTVIMRSAVVQPTASTMSSVWLGIWASSPMWSNNSVSPVTWTHLREGWMLCCKLQSARCVYMQIQGRQDYKQLNKVNKPFWDKYSIF